MKITGVSVDCMPGYANDPRFEINVDDYNEFKPIDRLFIEDDGKMWDIKYYECGLIKFGVYFMNEMNERKPFGGAFENEFGMVNGWSSNETSFNGLGLLDPVTDVTVNFDNGYRIGLVHIEVDKLQSLFDQYDVPYTIVLGDYGYYPEPITSMNVIWRVSGSVYVAGTYQEHTGLVLAVDESHAKDVAYKDFHYSMSKPVSVTRR
jgi:hypothetical protein